jgi:hypothetical protein
MESREAGVLLFPIKKGQPLDGSHAIARFARFGELQKLLITAPLPRASLILTTIPQNNGHLPLSPFPFSLLAVTFTQSFNNVAFLLSCLSVVFICHIPDISTWPECFPALHRSM